VTGQAVAFTFSGEKLVFQIAFWFYP